jgi:hypothetical protein
VQAQGSPPLPQAISIGVKPQLDVRAERFGDGVNFILVDC